MPHNHGSAAAAHKSTRTTPQKNRPYQILLHTTSVVQPKGTQALAVLQAWNERLQGDWEHAPTRRDYHAVLAAYASEGAAAANNNSNNYNVGSKNDDNNPHDPTRTETPDTNLEGAHVAVETTQWLQQQYVLDMRPNAETYALGCLCIAQAIRKKKKWNNNDEN
jgi:hypothetical protein